METRFQYFNQSRHVIEISTKNGDVQKSTGNEFKIYNESLSTGVTVAVSIGNRENDWISTRNPLAH